MLPSQDDLQYLKYNKSVRLDKTPNRAAATGIEKMGILNQFVANTDKVGSLHGSHNDSNSITHLKLRLYVQQHVQFDNNKKHKLRITDPFYGCPVVSPYKDPVMREAFLFHDVSMPSSIPIDHTRSLMWLMKDRHLRQLMF